MKKLHIIMVVFFMSFYAQAESSSATEVKQQSNSPNWQNRKTGFFSGGIRSEFTPSDEFLYYDSSVNLRYGHYISKHSFFEAGIDSNYLSKPIFFHLKYGYDLIAMGRTIPGIDISLLVGVEKRKNLGYPSYPYKYKNISEEEYVRRVEDYEKKSEEIREEESKVSLAVGFAVGMYVKTFVSRSAALVLRVGATHDTSSGLEDFDLLDTRMYMGLSVKWYLY